MGIRSIVKKGFGLGFQPKRWFGAELVKNNGKICADLVKDLIRKPERSTDLIEASNKEEADLLSSPSALLKRLKLSIGFMWIYFTASLLTVGYAIFLWLARGFILPGCVCVMVAFLLFIYGIREFMVYAQIRCGGSRKPLKVLLRELKKGNKKVSI